jgi:ATP-independent RNA helicase DbpA
MNAKGTVYLILADEEKYPFLKNDIETETLKGPYTLPQDSVWQTLYISAGKKDKVNKIDIVGFLLKKGGLQKDDVGLIEVKDQASYVAIKRKMTNAVIKALANEKIKNKKVKIETAF